MSKIIIDSERKRKLDKFVEEIIQVCKKHNISISHQDHHGAFEFPKYDEENSEWLRAGADADWRYRERQGK